MFLDQNNMLFKKNQ